MKCSLALLCLTQKCFISDHFYLFFKSVLPHYTSKGLGVLGPAWVSFEDPQRKNVALFFRLSQAIAEKTKPNCKDRWCL